MFVFHMPCKLWCESHSIWSKQFLFNKTGFFVLHQRKKSSFILNSYGRIQIILNQCFKTEADTICHLLRKVLLRLVSTQVNLYLINSLEGVLCASIALYLANKHQRTLAKQCNKDPLWMLIDGHKHMRI